MNLSSDEESEDEFSGRTLVKFHELGHEDDDGDDDVEWEDASVHQGDDPPPSVNPDEDDLYDSKPPAATAFDRPIRPIDEYNFVTVDQNTRRNLVVSRTTNIRKKRRLNKLTHISSEAKQLLVNLHRSHLLTETCRAIRISNLCCASLESLLMHVAFSLVPSYVHVDDEMPTLKQLELFTQWFHDFTNVKLIRERRRTIQIRNTARGAPLKGVTKQKLNRISSTKNHHDSYEKRNRKENSKRANSTTELVFNKMNPMTGEQIVRRLFDIIFYLAPYHDEDPDYIESFLDISPKDSVLLFICMTRSLKWRVRYCATFQLIPLHLTPSHPLFTFEFKNLIKNLYSHQNHLQPSLTKSRSKATSGKVLSKIEDPFDIADSMTNHDCIDKDDYQWVEVLCRIGDNDVNVTSHNSQSRSFFHSHQWVHVDVIHKRINEPQSLEHILHSQKKARDPIMYAIGVEHEFETDHCDCKRAHLTDITPRYSSSWSRTLMNRGATKKQLLAGNDSQVNAWWKDTVRKINGVMDQRRNKMPVVTIVAENTSDSRGTRLDDIYKVIDVDGDSNNNSVYSDRTKFIKSIHDVEEKEFHESRDREPLPTSKAAFKNHPIYAILSGLNSQEVLHPQASKRSVGWFKGERVFKRSDVSKALPSKQWLYSGRIVRDSELSKPVKTIKARRNISHGKFKTLETYGISSKVQGESIHENETLFNKFSGLIPLYGIWQTDEWHPPAIGPSDAIPVNEHNNVELALLNPGLVHLDIHRVASIARKLAIPYAPCLIGFEGHSGNRTPTIRGIVVHEHNAELLREAHSEWESKMIEDECSERKNTIYRRWKRLVIGILLHDRLERDYAAD